MSREMSERASSGRWRAALLLPPLLLALAGYARNLGDFPVADDLGILLRARVARGWLEAGGLEGGWNDGRWMRPIPLWSWWLQARAFGAAPWAYHLFDVAFHVLNAWLVGYLTIALTGRRGAGVAAAALFSVCPIHPQAVTWISGRFDVLATTGTLASLLAWLHFLGPGGRRRHLTLSALALVFGLASKEMALAGFPLLAAATFLRPGPRARVLRGAALFGALFAVYFGLRFWMLGGIGGPSSEESGQETLFAASSALRFLPRAFALCFLPAHYEDFPAPWHPSKLVPALAVSAMAVRSLLARGASAFLREVGPLLLLFLLSTGPVVGWTRLLADLHGSRFLYLPSAFSCAALGTVLCGPGARLHSPAAAAAAVVIGAWLVGLLHVNRRWHEAAMQTEARVRAIPADHERTLWVTDLPDNHHGVLTLRCCFAQGVFLYHDPKVEVRAVPRAAWEEELARPQENVRLLRWNEAASAWVDAR